MNVDRGEKEILDIVHGKLNKIIKIVIKKLSSGSASTSKGYVYRVSRQSKPISVNFAWHCILSWVQGLV